MENLYTGEEIGGARNRLKRTVLACVLPPSATVIVSILLCFFVNDANAAALMYTDIALCSVGGCVGLYLLLNAVLPHRARLAVLRELAGGTPLTVRATVESFGSTLTRRSGLAVREVTVSTEGGGERILFWDTEKPCPLTVGQAAEFRIVDNTVVAYEVTG